MCYATKFHLVGHVPPIHDSYRICFVRCVIPLFLSALCVCMCVNIAASELQSCQPLTLYVGMPKNIVQAIRLTVQLQSEFAMARRQKHIEYHRYIRQRTCCALHITLPIYLYVSARRCVCVCVFVSVRFIVRFGVYARLSIRIGFNDTGNVCIILIFLEKGRDSVESYVLYSN